MSRWLVTLWSWARSRRTSAATSCALGAMVGSLPAAAVDRLCLRPGKLPPPRAQALGGDAQTFGHPAGRHPALPLRHRRPLERLVVGTMTHSFPVFAFFAAHGVLVPPPRAAVYFIRAISASSPACPTPRPCARRSTPGRRFATPTKLASTGRSAWRMLAKSSIAFTRHLQHDIALAAQLALPVNGAFVSARLLTPNDAPLILLASSRALIASSR